MRLEAVAMRSVVLLFVLCCGAPAAQTIKQPTFFARRDYPTAFGWVAVADVNGDGIPDVITSGGPFLSILLGNGNGTLTPGPTTMPALSDVGLFAPVDLNGDFVCQKAIPTAHIPPSAILGLAALNFSRGPVVVPNEYPTQL
jgi:hypothetical protein